MTTPRGGRIQMKVVAGSFDYRDRFIILLIYGGFYFAREVLKVGMMDDPSLQYFLCPEPSMSEICHHFFTNRGTTPPPYGHVLHTRIQENGLLGSIGNDTLLHFQLVFMICIILCTLMNSQTFITHFLSDLMKCDVIYTFCEERVFSLH